MQVDLCLGRAGSPVPAPPPVPCWTRTVAGPSSVAITRRRSPAAPVRAVSAECSWSSAAPVASKSIRTRGRSGWKPLSTLNHVALGCRVTFTHGYAANGDLRMYYEVHGSATFGTRPLLLIPGGGSSIQTNFASIIPLLSAQRQVIAVDEEGHGRTLPTDRPLTTRTPPSTSLRSSPVAASARWTCLDSTTAATALALACAPGADATTHRPPPRSSAGTRCPRILGGHKSPPGQHPAALKARAGASTPNPGTSSGCSSWTGSALSASLAGPSRTSAGPARHTLVLCAGQRRDEPRPRRADVPRHPRCPPADRARRPRRLPRRTRRQRGDLQALHATHAAPAALPGRVENLDYFRIVFSSSTAWWTGGTSSCAPLPSAICPPHSLRG